MHKKIHRADRKLGINLFDKPNSPIVKRNYPLGQHGKRMKRRRSNYAERLVERQKWRALYNIKSGTLDTIIRKAGQTRKPDVSLFASLERRFDQVVYKLGFAPSIHSARQLVVHKHFLINGMRVNIPSYKLKPKDVVSVREKSKSIAIINRCIESKIESLPPYLKKQEQMTGIFMRLPETKEELGLHFNINPTAVIESLR